MLEAEDGIKPVSLPSPQNELRRKSTKEVTQHSSSQSSSTEWQRPVPQQMHGPLLQQWGKHPFPPDSPSPQQRFYHTGHQHPHLQPGDQPPKQAMGPSADHLHLPVPLTCNRDSEFQPSVAIPKQRSAIACLNCRKKKCRCAGFERLGKCLNCARHGLPCIFVPLSSQVALAPAAALNNYNYNAGNGLQATQSTPYAPQDQRQDTLPRIRDVVQF